MSCKLCFQIAALSTLGLLLVSCGQSDAPTQPAGLTPSGGDGSTEPPPSPVGPAKITVSKETTWVVAPINDRGRVDFIAAVNKLAGDGVTPEQNVVVPLVKILGSGRENAEEHARFVQLLGIPEAPQKATGTVLQGDFVKSEGIKDADRFYENCETAGSRPWKVSEFPDVDRWLKSCSSQLDACVQASELPRYYYPLVTADLGDDEGGGEVITLINTLLPLPQGCRDVARGLTARAMRAAGAGDVKAAQHDLLALYRLSRLLSQGETLIECLVGISIESMAGDCVVAMINAGHLNGAGSREWQAAIRALKPPAGIIRPVDQVERLSAIEVLINLADHGPKVLAMASGSENRLGDVLIDSTAVDWDAALRRINQRYDQLVADFRIPKFSDRATALAASNEEVRQDGEKSLTILDRLLQGHGGEPTEAGEKLANIVIALIMPAAPQVHVAETRRKMKLDLVLLALRINDYRVEHGKFPEHLEELPGPAAPDDAFTGAPLIYKPTEKGVVLYAQGADQSDSGGPRKNPNDTSDDLGFELVKRPS